MCTALLLTPQPYQTAFFIWLIHQSIFEPADSRRSQTQEKNKVPEEQAPKLKEKRNVCSFALDTTAIPDRIIHLVHIPKCI